MKTLDTLTKANVSYNNLAKAYREALEEDGFQEFVSHLHLPDEELMKYTSSLLDAKEEYEHCTNCKNLLSCKNKMNGYCYLPRVLNNQIVFEYRICRFQKKKNQENAYLKNIYTFDVSEDIKNARMKNVYSDDKNRVPAIKWTLKFIKEYPNIKKGLYLHGNFGSGKTYLISAMFNELAHQNIKSAIVFWPEFLRDLKSSFGTDFKEKYERIKKVPLLLIDDIGAENTTAWERDEILSPLLQHRMQEHLPTFFTSNLTIEELEMHLSISKENVDLVKARRIIERIKQLTENQEMVSKNLRD